MHISPITAALLLCASATLCAATPWPTPWGPDYEAGAANRITPASVTSAAGLVRTGRTYHLGIVMDAQTPAFSPRTLSLTVLQPQQWGGATLGSNDLTGNDDILHTWLGIGSQLDGLGHIGVRETFYTGRNRSDFAAVTGLTRFGIEKVPPLVARGVLLDMAAFYGTSPLPEGTAYTEHDIKAAARAQRVQLREGDVVLFHSGWLALAEGDVEDRARFIAAEPGLGRSGARFLAKLGVVAVGADTWGVEVVPFEDPLQVFRVHQILLVMNGIYTLENMDTRDLVRDNVWEFMFVLGAARVRGAVQMMINPIAIA